MILVVLLVLAIVFIIVATTRLGLHPFLALLLAAMGFGLLAGMPPNEVVASVNQGFGGILGYIGIVILAGSIIGTFLERSGGALRLAEAVLRITGRRNVPAAMGVVGYTVSLPVFCDSGFVILSPLSKALAHRTGTTLAAAAIALSLGLYATHTMVPPTPGPVAAAGILGADLGRVILWGLLVAAIAVFAGWLFATKVGSRYAVPAYREETSPDPATESADVEREGTPSAARALAPILLPIVLIVLGSIERLPGAPLGEGALATALGFFGEPVIALLAGVSLAITLPGRLERRHLGADGWIGDAVVAAATILIITGAGGAFGKVLQNSGIGDVLGDALAGAGLGIWLPFLIAAAIKTAQGSSTVAIITTAGLLAPLLDSLGLGGETARALCVVAIGAGSMVVSHANDSYFWVVTQFSNMDLSLGYRLQTLGTLVQGVAAAAAVWIISLVVL
jgi:GntP family gluconate:H+ symporter